jgi:hypothetical protein
MIKEKPLKNDSRHAFLINTFFPGVEGYATKMIGDFTLVKNCKHDTGECYVSIYRNDAYFRRESYLAYQKQLELGLI